VSKDSSTTTISSSANPSVNGQTVTITATVTANSPGSGTPAGTVTFKVNGIAQATVKLNAQDNAAFVFSPTVGTYTVTASYNGGADFTFSASSPLHQVVNKDATTVLLVSSLNPSTSGQAVTFTATVSAAAPGSGVPAGTVEFLDGTTVLGFQTLVAGKVFFKTSTLSVGSHSITARYEGSTLFNARTSTVLNQIVNAAAVILETEGLASSRLPAGGNATAGITTSHMLLGNEGTGTAEGYAANIDLKHGLLPALVETVNATDTAILEALLATPLDPAHVDLVFKGWAS